MKDNEPEADNNDRASKGFSYYYVVIPPEDQALSNDTSMSVTSSQELATIMKRNPRARFHAGSSVEEAMKRATEKIKFSQDTVCFNLSPKVAEPKRRNRSSLSAIESCLGAPAMKSPEARDLLMIGQEISRKQNETVRMRIENNPRILVTDTEAPTTLHEGCKYNALHLAAKCNNSDILQHILNLISSLEFMERIYPTVSPEQRRYSTKQLVNCYLNTPDKMTQETPLHYACKFNNVECVQLLLSHPWCDIAVKNFEKLTPYQIVGSRADSKGTKFEAIKRLFEERYIVPIWRDEDVMGDPPAIGDVSFIHDLGQAIPPPLLAKFPDFSISLLDPCSQQLLPMRGRNVFMSQPPAWRVKAFAGPVSEKKASELRQLLVRSRGVHLIPANSHDSSFTAPGTPGNAGAITPDTPKTNSPYPSNQVVTPPPPLQSFFSSPVPSPFTPRSTCDSPVLFRGRCESPGLNSSRTDMSIRVRDAEKGLERIALEYCKEMNIPWSEYWPFLEAYCDLATEAGLGLLEQHLCTLETKRLTKVLEEKLIANNNSLDSLIDKLERINLDGSGMSSPGSGGFCPNPRCRLEFGFCNCENVIPNLPCVVDDEDDSVREPVLPFGDDTDTESQGVEAAGGLYGQTIMEMRKLNTSCNTNSSGSASSETTDFDALEELLFATAPTSPVENDVFEDCCNQPIFLNGEQLGKIDLQVFQILQDFEEKIDKTKYLATFQWINSMRAVGEPLGLSSRRGPLGASGYIPKRLWEPPYVSTPCYRLTKESWTLPFLN